MSRRNQERVARKLMELEKGLSGLARARQVAFSDVPVTSVDDAGNLVESDVPIPELFGDIQIDVEQFRQDITDAQDRLDEARADLDTLAESTLPGLDSRLADAEAAVTAAEGRLADAEVELTDLTTNVLPGLTDALDGVQGELSDHAARMLAAEQAVAAAEAAVTAAEGELATLRDTTLPALDGRLGTAEAAVDAVESAVSSAQSELGTLTDTTLPALDSRLGSAESAVSAAEGRLTDAEAELSTLETDLGTVSGNIGDLIGRVGTVESDVSAAQSAAQTANQVASDANQTAQDAWNLALEATASASQRLNGAVNPSFETGVDGWSVAGGRIERSATSWVGADGNWHGRIFSSETSPGQAVTATSTQVPIQPGQWAGVAAVMGGYSAANLAVQLVAHGSPTNYYTSPLTSAGISAPVRLVRVAQVDADTTHVSAALIQRAVSGNLPENYAAYVDQVMLVIGDSEAAVVAALDAGYFDGDTPDRTDAAGTLYQTQWTGAPHASTSIETAYTSAMLEIIAEAHAATAAAQAADGKAVLAQQSADGKSTVTYGASKKASGAAGSEGDTHYVFSGSNLIATQRRTATAWVDAELGHQIIGSVDLGKATVGQLDGQYIKADTITGQKILAGSITAADAVFGNGAIQNADIGNLNASKINAGTLDAARIGAGSIDATKISSYNLTTANATIGNSVITNAMIADLNASKINAGTLAAARIGAGTIDSTKISSYNLTSLNATIANGVITNAMIANLDASKINAGTLDAARIGANSITAEKLVITPSNLFPDPFFLNTAEWSGTDISVVSHPDFAVGNALQLVTATAQRGTYYASSAAPLGTVQFEPGKSYRVRVRARVEGAPGPALRVYFRGQDANGSDTSPSALLIPAGEAVTPAGTANVYEATIAVAETVIAPRTVGFYTSSPYSAGTTFLINDVQVNVVAGATLIEDGAITTDKVAANAITGAKILAGSITASHGVFATGAIQNADIGNLNASKINAGTLAAARIGAGSIDTTHLSAGAVTSAKITADELTGLDIVGSKFRLLGEDGSEAVVLAPGTANFAVFGSADQHVAISSDGQIAAEVGAFNEITYAGESLNVILDDRGKGVVYDAQFTLPSDSYNSTQYMSIFGAQFELEADRRYMLVCDTGGNLLAYKQGGSFTLNADIRCMPTTGLPGLNDLSTGRIYWDQQQATRDMDRIFDFTRVYNVRAETTQANMHNLLPGLNSLRAKIWRPSGSDSWGFTARGNAGRFTVIDVGPALDEYLPSITDHRTAGSGGGDNDGNTGGARNYTKTYNATWSQSYLGSGAQRPDGTNYLYQGYTSYYPAGGTQRSQIGFNDAQIRSDLSGATIQSVEVYVFYEHWWAGSGGNARIGTHSNSNKPSSFTGANTAYYSDSNNWPRAAGRWVKLNSAEGDRFKSGTARGITLNAVNTSNTYYGYARGVGQSYAPKLRIKYRK